MALQKVQGKVEQVFIKAMDKADRYENTHRVSIKLDDGEWYQMGGSKYPNFTVQDDDGKWKELGVGSEVLIKYEQNGDWKNSSRGKMTVLELVEGDSSSKSSSASTASTGSSGGGGYAKRDAGIEAGHAINNAVAILNAKQAGIFTTKELLEKAREIHAATRNLQYDILEGSTTEAEKKPATKPKSQPKVEEVEADDKWDDDLPFN